MKRARMFGAVLAGVLAFSALPASAGGSTWTATPGGWVSGSLEHVKTVADTAAGASDAVLHEGYLYVSTWRSFTIYDVRNPLDPQPVATEHLGPSLYNEQPQTNGEILLLSRDMQYAPRVPGAPPAGAVMEIFDVRDKANPRRITTYESVRRDHLWTCVRDCAYAYSASGTILDLRDPANPTRVGDWSQIAPYRDRRFHYIAEVADGVVMTGSLPVHVLDARGDAANPTLMLSVEPATTVPLRGLNQPESIPGRLDWPGASSRLSVITMETPFSGPCDEGSGDVQTFLTPGWRGSGTFQLADRYQLARNGTFADGAPPANAVGCSAYGLDLAPSFANNGGLAAVSFFEHGVRVLDIDVHGRIAEHGGFLPHAGDSTAAHWVTDDILYVVDLHRGLDILRVRR